MTSDWAAAVASLTTAPTPGPTPSGSGASGVWTPGRITSAAVATFLSILVVGFLSILLARRREEFERAEKGKERAHDRQKEIGEAAAKFVGVAYGFRSGAPATHGTGAEAENP
ncbi:hypothetical protein ACFU96_48315 [Streptomyces sp. NPDC057620]|uniref:hypothetical protein n=1 Tax=Streptomyces sp. NPDC057620 TaxID=3346185 RepID=UPI0036C06C0F